MGRGRLDHARRRVQRRAEWLEAHLLTIIQPHTAAARAMASIAQVHRATFDVIVSPQDWQRRCFVPCVSHPLSLSHRRFRLWQLRHVSMI